MVAQACKSGYWGGWGRRLNVQGLDWAIEGVQGQPGQLCETLSQKKKVKKEVSSRMMLAEHEWEALGSTSSAKKIRILNVLPYGENRSLPTTADLNVDLNKHILCLNRPYFGIHSSSLRLNLQTCQAAIFFFFLQKKIVSIWGNFRGNRQD